MGHVPEVGPRTAAGHPPDPGPTAGGLSADTIRPGADGAGPDADRAADAAGRRADARAQRGHPGQKPDFQVVACVLVPGVRHSLVLPAGL